MTTGKQMQMQAMLFSSSELFPFQRKRALTVWRSYSPLDPAEEGYLAPLTLY
ncbi:hypothetical protein PENSUB_9473 [Penicillium subrubescens]|jgi:hypothetical protein|uniref:Uncharacterized protein n=2 Tax=Penicillium subrubescens TaxID=1316194 RepID=A0A1Q5TDR8_9EURO|nr:hypothetical protein PENSUB_9473 [Penicillium subrubescens]